MPLRGGIQFIFGRFHEGVRNASTTPWCDINDDNNIFAASLFLVVEQMKLFTLSFSVIQILRHFVDIMRVTV